MHELLTLEEFLAASFNSKESEAETSDWMPLNESYNPHKALSEVHNEQMAEFPSSTTQTQNQILLMWKSEYETPCLDRKLKIATSPHSLSLFSGDFGDYEYVDDNELAAMASQSRLSPTHSLLFSSPAGRKTIKLSDSTVPPDNPFGFTTASGKKMKIPSAESVAKAEILLQFNDDDSNDEENTQLVMVSNTSIGFNTASGKRIKSPSKAAKEKARNILSDTYEQQPETKREAISMTPVRAEMPLFTMASGKKVKSPTKESITRANKLMKDFDDGIIQKSETPTFNHIPSTRNLALHPRKSPVVRNDVVHPAPPNLPTKQSNTAKPIASDVSLYYPPPQGRAKLSGIRLLTIDSAIAASSIPFSVSDVLDLSKPLWPLANDAWLNNHTVAILWKLLSYARGGISCYEEDSLTPNSLINQLSYRYVREFVLAHRSILKRICERDDGANSYMILFTSHISLASEDKYNLFLSDGWYNMKTIYDETTKHLIEQGRIKIGTKMKIALARVVSDEACDILEANTNDVCLKIHGNSMAPAKWHSRLGKQKANLFTVSINSIDVNGGMIACINVVILRRYPAIYMVEYESGKKQSMSPSKFSKLETLVETECDDKILSMRLTARMLVVDNCGCSKASKAIITLWETNQEILEQLVEGTTVKIIGLRPSSNQKGAIIQLSSTRNATRLIFTGINSGKYLQRTAPMTFAGLDSPEIHKEYDIVGRVVVLDSEHCWLLVGEEIKRVIAIKVMNKKLDAPIDAPLLCFLDVIFLYSDPRHNFPVFLYGDFSQVMHDRSKMEKYIIPTCTSNVDDEQSLAKARQFVRKITKNEI